VKKCKPIRQTVERNASFSNSLKDLAKVPPWIQVWEKAQNTWDEENALMADILGYIFSRRRFEMVINLGHALND
jgi:hypothetical protein